MTTFCSAARRLGIVLFLFFALPQGDQQLFPGMGSMGQEMPPPPDLNATNGTLAVAGPMAATDANSTVLPIATTAEPLSAGPLERLGQLAKSLSPFPLNNSAPAPPTGPMLGASLNGTNTSPVVVAVDATNSTGAFTPFNSTVSPLEVPPTASTNSPAIPLAAAPVVADAEQYSPLSVDHPPVPMNKTTTTTSPPTPPSPSPPPQPASAIALGGWTTTSMLIAGSLALYASMMV